MARPKLGQHFLIQGSILERIAAGVCPKREALVIEIGPGRGALTERLLRRADRVIAIEIDRELVEYLRTKFADEPRLEVTHADVLDVDLTRWRGAPISGNLPYYITSPILLRAVAVGAPRAVFLIQKEVADRLVAQPRSRDYGYLTVATRFYSEARIIMPVHPGAFHPPPKVESAVVSLEPHATPWHTSDPLAFLRFVGLCFHQKRKTIRNNLMETYGKELVGAWPEAGLRAEQISIEDFLEMFGRVSGLAETATLPAEAAFPGGLPDTDPGKSE